MNKVEKIIAVMMPVYNAADTIALAISSLQNQTYKNWKCYIVNDGSSDGTKRFLDALDDPRFIIHHFEFNRGRPFARQKALELVEGDYLAYLDSDDFYHPEKLEKQVALLESNLDVDLVSCGMGSYDGSFNLVTVKGKKVHPPTVYKMIHNYYPARAACMIRMGRAKMIKYNFALKYAQDTDYFTRYINNRKFMVTDDVLYYYSEFSSVDMKKILSTYLHGVTRGKGILRLYPLAGLKLIALSLMKFSYMTLKTKFINQEAILKSRGQKPNVAEEKEFKNVLAKLKST